MRARTTFGGLLLLAAALPGTAAAHDGTVATTTLAARAYVEEQATPEGPMRLTVGEHRFWFGGQIAAGSVAAPDLCDLTVPCPRWTLELPAGGHRLRVAIDTPSREDAFTVQVLDAGGRTVATGTARNQFNGEAFLARPPAGRYVVRVVPEQVSAAFFRLRAKLEAAPSVPADPKRELLPNLKAVPPYEFTFTAPLNPANGLYPPDTVNPPVSVLGAEPVSCAPDELAPVALGGQGAHDCLRLTSGPINVGEGPFVKRFFLARDLADGVVEPATLRGPASQTIYHADGSTSTRPAGHYSFHTTHAHFHDEGILTYELLRVEADGTTLTPAGAGTKSGFCPADQLFGEWRRFAQDPTGTFSEGDSATGSCFSPSDGTFALTRGWGDVYRWQRPGQFVEWRGNGDGRYVVRTTVDKGDVTRESDETDNSSYALIRVVGRRVETLERGQGTSHLDPRKEVFTGYGPASQDPVGGELPATASVDRVAPRIAGLRLLRGRGRGARGGTLVLRLSEPATVTVTLARRDGRRLRRVGTMRFPGRAGLQRRRLSAPMRRALARPGVLVLGVVARDAAQNRRAARPLTVRVR